MKVCHITSMHDWDDDRIYQRACLGLARESIKVFLIATKPNILPTDSPIHFKWIKARSGIKRRWYSSKDCVAKAIALQADIYHFHDPDLLPHILRIKQRLPKAKIIYDIHENYAGRFKNWGLPVFLGKYFRAYEKHIISKLDGFTVVSESMLDLFKGSKTLSIIIRNSTDINRLSDVKIKKIKKNKVFTIYTSGTNSSSRNCLETVKSLKYINLPDIKFNMLFVGKYAKGIKNDMLDQAKLDKTSHLLNLEGMLPWEENFKRTAKALDIPIIILSQENEDGKTADSKALLRDADFWFSTTNLADKGIKVWKIEDNEGKWEVPVDTSYFEVKNKGNRHGPAGTRILYRYNENGTYTEVDYRRVY